MMNLVAEELGRKYPLLDVAALKISWAKINPSDYLALSDALHLLYPGSK